MNRVILTSEICDKGGLCILKYSSKNDFNNYFFGPNIAIKLYSPKVTYVDANSISFGFEKTCMVDGQIKDNLNLFLLLKKINETLIGLYSVYKETRGHQMTDQVPCLYNTVGDNLYYIRCTLPSANGKYFIKTDNGYFTKPRVGAVYSNVTIDIRNIWEIPRTGKNGFRLELKEIEH